MPGSGNIILTGFMGTGKTTVGRLLAERLDMDFVDTDELIEKRHGPIPDIFAVHGEPHFRALEQSIAEMLAQRSQLVIATGGGMLIDPSSAALLSATGQVVCLTASADDIRSRLSDSETRPLLNDRGDIERILAERRRAYEAFPQIDTSGLDPDEVATAVIALL